MHSLFELQSFMCCRDASLWVPLSPCFLHNCHQSKHAQIHIFMKSEGSHHHLCTDIKMHAAYTRLLTGVSRPEVVWVAGKEGLMVLCRQVHVVVSQRLSTRYPRIPEQQHRHTFIISNWPNAHVPMNGKNESEWKTWADSLAQIVRC